MKVARYRSGQALVEFALLATLMITMLLGIFDFGRAYYTQVQIKNAVGDAGYYAIQHPDDDAGIRKVIEKQLSFLTDSDIPDPVRTCTSGVGKTKIKVTYDYHLMFSWIIPNAKVTLGDETYVPQLEAC
jgi:Flp pilus assembly protein TadG